MELCVLIVTLFWFYIYICTNSTIENVKSVSSNNAKMTTIFQMSA